MEEITNERENMLTECVLLHGSPFVGKTTYYYSTMRDNYTRVCPQELLRNDASLNLRLLIHQHVLRPLSVGINVVVDDCAQTRDIRKSYTQLIANKLPNVMISYHKLRPEHGLQQLQWQKEFHIARAFVQKDWDLVRALTSVDFHQWSQKCDEISDEEGFKTIQISTQLHISSSFVPLMPCLLFDWPCAIDDKLKDLLTYWNRFNRAGRIIAIARPNSSTTGVRNDASELNNSTADIDRLTLMVDFPLYLYWSDDVNQEDQCTPSDLAFLMQLHEIDLLEQNSIYLYSSVGTKTMLEKTGMKHLKIDRALSNPDLLRFGAVQCTVPPMIQGIQVVPLIRNDESEDLTPQLPLFKDGLKSLISFDRHRIVYISAASEDVLHRSQEIYAKNVTPINGPARVDLHRKAKLATIDFPVVEMFTEDKASETSGNAPTHKRVKRKTLPSWMSSKRCTTSPVNRSPKKSVRVPSTVYVMNERELLLTAQLLIDEAENYKLSESNEKLDTCDVNNDDDNTARCATTTALGFQACNTRTLMNSSVSYAVETEEKPSEVNERGGSTDKCSKPVSECSKVISADVCQQDLNLKTFLDELI